VPEYRSNNSIYESLDNPQTNNWSANNQYFFWKAKWNH
jgi:hypothetical protein